MESGYGRFYVVKESCCQATVTQFHVRPHAHNVFLKDPGLGQEWAVPSVLAGNLGIPFFGLLVLFIK